MQRFNSALELSLHFHILVPDGVFVAGDGGVDERPRFVELEAPSDAEVAKLLAEVARRLEWSLLVKRAYALDVLSCPRCQGPMRLIAVIDNELVVCRILAHLGLPARAPPRGQGRCSGQDHLPGLDARPEPADAFDGVDPLPLETC